MKSNSSSSSSTRRLLTAAAIVGLTASSVVSATPETNATSAAGRGLDLDHRIGPNAKPSEWNWNDLSNKNWIFDHLMKNKGSLNYCVRWDSDTKLTKSVASKFQAILNRQYKAWNQWLVGYDCWPYSQIDVKIVGFAVKDKSQLDWSDDSLGKIYAGDLDSDGVPQCPQSCYRFYDNAAGAWADTSSCQDQVWDISLWPKQGLDGGFGDDWGQEVNLENMLAALDNDQLTIVAHEIGHGFGLPDFYEEADMPNSNFPVCIMRAGSSMTITPGDGWMLRRVWEHLKPRYNVWGF
ncbi:neutral zinc metallopeptidase, Zn-binding site [Phytophthora sojae]|uniref:Neutral zinc metallopeptidase, Zn-binding site n=1 Tax=Phytophthora sojae (strain P6497) TaxID=1094619 RepID=G4ZSE4_PHYSP|nr:neutral zinc metallopeptidase, Zn-binding site [Phytophthora sojae]EGZ14024.1 neutral zinc metallopeptidase, Zn-binding site [Phytophthora sojae]|eukprot:XP_009531453.1 neutral zinc metallopeptidase, Zn-binding site [Phytophthora sojae]